MAEKLRQPCKEIARIILWQGEYRFTVCFLYTYIFLLTNFVLAPWKALFDASRLWNHNNHHFIIQMHQSVRNTVRSLVQSSQRFSYLCVIDIFTTALNSSHFISVSCTILLYRVKWFQITNHDWLLWDENYKVFYKVQGDLKDYYQS